LDFPIQTREKMNSLPNAPDNKKTQFAAPQLIIGFIIVALLLLFFFFPKQELLTRIEKQRTADRVARIYIQNLVALYPNNQSLKLIGADQDIQFGELASAIKQVLPLVTQQPSSPNDWKALWLYYQIIRTETYALPEVSDARAKGLVKMQGLLATLTKHFFTSSETLILANDAIALGKPDMAIMLYKNIARTKPEASDVLYTEGAKFALSQGEYQLSADLYFITEQHSQTIAAKRQNFIAGLKSLQSGNLLNDALLAAEKYLGELSNDRTTLVFLTKLALAANQPALAEVYIKRALWGK